MFPQLDADALFEEHMKAEVSVNMSAIVAELQALDYMLGALRASVMHAPRLFISVGVL